MGKKIYITGHRNPDLDSLCSAYAYAALKNQIDPENEYQAVRCGQVSDSIEKQLEMVGVEAPPLMADVFPKVGDVMLKTSQKVETSEPVYYLVKSYQTDNPSVTPLFENGKFAGLLSVDDITAWFLKDNQDDDPKYDFTVDNIKAVLPGQILQRGCRESFTAPVAVGAASLQDFSDFILKGSDAVVVMGARPEHIRLAIRENFPAIIITTIRHEVDAEAHSESLPEIRIEGTGEIEDEQMPQIEFAGYEGLIYITSLSTAETIRRLRLCEPLGNLMKQPQETVQAADLFMDVKELLTSSSRRGLAVMDNDTFTGFVTRRCFLNKPAYNVIMVDHNEAGQSIKGIETASIVEIVDHHRLDAVKTELPILIDARPLGSTCTIVWQQYLAHGVMPDPDAARMLLTGVLSDTLILKSPTTTETDRKTVEQLAKVCGVDYREFGEMLYSVTANLGTKDPETAIKSDFKMYESSGVKVGIGQCETTTLANIDEYADIYLKSLEEVRNQNGLDWAMLMVTDVLSEKSILLTTVHRDGAKLPYEKIARYNDPEASGGRGYRAFDMPGVMSRKKQLLPAVLKAIEE